MTETGQTPPKNPWRKLPKPTPGFWLALAVLSFCSLLFVVPRGPTLSQAQQHTQYQEKPTTHDSASKPDAPSSGNDERQGWSHVKENIKQRWNSFAESMEQNDEVVVAISTIVIASFTVALFVTSYLLWDAGKRHSERELRAYVSVTPDFVTGFNPTTRAAVKFSMVNYGTTPARNVRQSAIVDIFPYPLLQDFPFPDAMLRAAGTFIIHPSEKFIGSRVASRLFTSNEIDDVVAGTSSRIYIFGEVSYEDVFGVERRTRFCSSVVGSENLAQVAGLRGAVPDKVDISFEPSDQHNKAT